MRKYLALLLILIFPSASVADTWGPTDAAYNADSENSAKYPADGGLGANWIGYNTGLDSGVWRVGIEWDISFFDGTETISKVEFRLQVDSKASTTESVEHNRYGTLGQSAQSDITANFYARINSGTTYTTVDYPDGAGSPSAWTDLGATAVSDFQSAIGTYSVFCLGLMSTNEATNYNYWYIDENTTFAPELQVTYTTGGGPAAMPQLIRVNIQ